jgi:putative phosphoribosyl transferase
MRLAERLRNSVTSDTIVLGIASGGVPAAAVVAHQLGLAIDIVLIKRLFAPNGPMFPVCATSVAGALVIDDFSPHMTELASLDSFVDFSLRDLAHRENSCRGGKPVFEIRGKNVILVDNGVHTGSTMLCAIRAIRKLEPLSIVSVVPVVAAASRGAIESVTNEFICLASAENFGHVGLWYSDFTKPSDKDICHLLNGSNAVQN